MVVLTGYSFIKKKSISNGILCLASIILLIWGANSLLFNLDVADELASYKVEAAEIYNEYENNGLAAQEKYDGQIIEITGKINSIKRSFSDSLEEKSAVLLNSGKFLGKSITVYVSDKSKKYLMDLSKGDQVTIKGKVSSFSNDSLVLQKGTIVSPQ